MAEVKVSGLWKVVVTEYERSWGQRCDPDDTKFFTTLEEAQAYSDKMSGGDYDCYWRGEITKVG